MSTMGTINAGHFDGGRNLNSGQRHQGEDILEELLAAAKVDILALEGVDAVAKQGEEAVSGAGDVAVTFAAAYADADYQVTGLVFEDDGGSGANDVVMRVKSGTKLATGFTVELAGTTPSGAMHWRTAHN